MSYVVSYVVSLVNIIHKIDRVSTAQHSVDLTFEYETIPVNIDIVVIYYSDTWIINAGALTTNPFTVDFVS